MIEEHTIPPPPWLAEFVERLTPHVQSTGFSAPLGYGWWAPGDAFNTFAGWQLAVNLLPLKVVGGSQDGGIFRAGFLLDVGPVLAFFSHVARVEWYNPPRYNDPSATPELRIEGHLLGIGPLRLRMLASAPPNEQACHELTADKDQLNVRAS